MSELVVSVFFNSFWIVGLALLLAAFSYHYDRAQQSQRSLREQLGARSFSFAAWISGTLVGMGLIGTSSTIWERLIWITFTLYAVINVIALWRLQPPDPSDGRPFSDQGH